MKAVILAGGLGTRLSEETGVRPKPMVEIGGMPIIWHIMKIYSHYGINDFIVCCGYKGYVIKEYFANYLLHRADLRIDLQNNQLVYEHSKAEPWSITLVDTGEHTSTGGRLRRVERYLRHENYFCVTYGDGLSDVDVTETINSHQASGKLVTITATFPPGRFGRLEVEGSSVKRFVEKPRGDGGLINGGYFVMCPRVFDYLDGDNSVLEKEPLERLAIEGELNAHRHYGFWQPMDTLRDKHLLEELWGTGAAPWKLWCD